MPLAAGILNRRVTLQRVAADAPDPHGQPGPFWSDVAEIWAAVEPLAGREYLQAMASHSEATVKIRIRYRPDVTARDRIILRGVQHDIESVIDIDDGHEELQLMCRVRSATDDTAVGVASTA